MTDGKKHIWEDYGVLCLDINSKPKQFKTIDEWIDYIDKERVILYGIENDCHYDYPTFIHFDRKQNDDD